MGGEQTQTPTLRVLTYNIRHARGMDGAVSLERICGVIRDSGAGLVALQEVDRYRFRSGLVHQARRLGRKLGMRAIFGPTIRWWLFGIYGNAILSRYPVRSVARHRLPGGGEPRGLIVCRVAVPGGEAHFLCTHLGLSAQARRWQITRLLEVLESLPGPAILAGDFNCGPDAPELEPLLARLTDTCTDPGGVLTFPSIRPAHRVDYIFVSPPWQSLACGTVDSQTSDHLPYFAEISPGK